MFEGEDLHLLGLCSIPELGPVTITALLDAFGSAQAVFKAPASALESVEGVGKQRVSGILEFKDWDGLKRGIDKALELGARVVFRGREGYPAVFEELGAHAPHVLYIRGSIAEEDRFAVAIVGSRSYTDYGRTAAGNLARELGRMGMTVVSGLARGIDSYAHKGCLEGGGRTIGVLGCGIDVTYPPENKALTARVAADGAVITEFPPGTRPFGGNFPRRNRLISALSLGVIVIEAALKSGSLITAELALEQGREVFAVPGSILSPQSEGTNDLIRRGARIVTNASDVVEELAPLLEGFIKRASGVRVDISPEEKTLCDVMGAEPVHIDELARQSGLPMARALSVLMSLEIKGAVKQIEGKRFHLII